MAGKLQRQILKTLYEQGYIYKKDIDALYVNKTIGYRVIKSMVAQGIMKSDPDVFGKLLPGENFGLEVEKVLGAKPNKNENVNVNVNENENENENENVNVNVNVNEKRGENNGSNENIRSRGNSEVHV